MGKSYYKRRKGSWSKVFQDGIKDIFDGIGKKIGEGGPIFFKNCINPAARLVIFILLILTLLLSGIGFYTWIILIMLILILQFV